MKGNESAEMYLETIYLLDGDNKGVRTIDVAKAMDVSKPSVTNAMNRLKNDGLVHKELYGIIKLTPEGVSYAKKIYNRHKVMTNFFMKSLKVDSELAERNACRIEHVIDDELFEAIIKYMQD